MLVRFCAEAYFIFVLFACGLSLALTIFAMRIHNRSSENDSPSVVPQWVSLLLGRATDGSCRKNPTLFLDQVSYVGVNEARISLVVCFYCTGWPKKVSYYQIIKKLYYIV